jgi:hypothetical protein
VEFFFIKVQDNKTIEVAQQMHHQQQQQQHNILSQASWGRLEMKPKRDEKQGDA